jgi:hypothetical protein
MGAAKEYDYVVTVKKQGQNVFNLVSIFLIIIATGFNMYAWYLSPLLNNKWLVPALVASVLVIIFYQFSRSKKGDFIPSYGWALSLCGAAFILGPLHSFLFGSLYFLASFFERQVKHPLEFGFDKSGIVLNSVPSKNYTWSEVINVVLKDNILTLDFKNNRIIQRETEDIVSSETEKEFNEFCRLQMGKSF